MSNLIYPCLKYLMNTILRYTYSDIYAESPPPTHTHTPCTCSCKCRPTLIQPLRKHQHALIPACIRAPVKADLTVTVIIHVHVYVQVVTVGLPSITSHMYAYAHYTNVLQLAVNSLTVTVILYR